MRVCAWAPVGASGREAYKVRERDGFFLLLGLLLQRQLEGGQLSANLFIILEQLADGLAVPGQVIGDYVVVD